MIVTLKKTTRKLWNCDFFSRNFNINCTDVDFNIINFPEYLFLCLLSFRMPLYIQKNTKTAYTWTTHGWYIVHWLWLYHDAPFIAFYHSFINHCKCVTKIIQYLQNRKHQIFSYFYIKFWKYRHRLIVSSSDNKSVSHWIMFDYFFHGWKVNIFFFLIMFLVYSCSHV